MIYNVGAEVFSDLSPPVYIRHLQNWRTLLARLGVTGDGRYKIYILHHISLMKILLKASMVEFLPSPKGKRFSIQINQTIKVKC